MARRTALFGLGIVLLAPVPGELHRASDSGEFDIYRLNRGHGGFSPVYATVTCFGAYFKKGVLFRADSALRRRAEVFSLVPKR